MSIEIPPGTLTIPWTHSYVDQAAPAAPPAPEQPVRSVAEIQARIRSYESADFFGTQRDDLIGVLPFAAAREWLKPDADPAHWNPESATPSAVKARALDYMPFAWDKANNRRGLSAGRSINHMTAWLWLLGDPLADELEGMYRDYGKPCLVAICEKYGWNWRQWDDDRWTNHESSEGVPADQVRR